MFDACPSLEDEVDGDCVGVLHNAEESPPSNGGATERPELPRSRDGVFVTKTVPRGSAGNVNIWAILCAGSHCRGGRPHAWCGCLM